MIDITIKEFMKENELSYNAIKFLYKDAKQTYHLDNYYLIMFKDSEKLHGMKYIYKLDFTNNRVTLVQEDLFAKYNVFNKKEF